MPTLRKAPKKPRRRVGNEERHKIYDTRKWRELRLSKLRIQPLCELCLEMDKITPAVDVHHIDSFTNYDGMERIEKAYDSDNLLSLCKDCHSWLHRHGPTKGINIKQEAKELEEYYRLIQKS